MCNGDFFDILFDPDGGLKETDTEEEFWDQNPSPCLGDDDHFDINGWVYKKEVDVFGNICWRFDWSSNQDDFDKKTANSLKQ